MFHKEHFCHVASTNRGCPQYSIYVYKTTDSVETMLAEGYFNGALLDLHKNDVIIAEIISDVDAEQFDLVFFRVVSRTLEHVSVERTIIDKDILDKFVKKSGDTMTGALRFSDGDEEIGFIEANYTVGDNQAIRIVVGDISYIFNDIGEFYTYPEREGFARTLGTKGWYWKNIYVNKINNGADITIPSVNGTITLNEVNFQTPITDDNKGATMAELTPIAQDVEALKGAGGALTAYDFGAAPTQEQLTKYAVDQIWVGNTNWAWNAENPAASTFTDANGVSRTAAEIFNSTWVNNLSDNTRWQLTNTQNTEPKVFEWANVGRDIVAIANPTTAGIVRVGDGSQMVVNASTGDISLDGSKAESIRGTIGAVANNQGADNAGKFMGVNTGGDVVPTEIQFPGDYVIYWDSADSTDHSHAKPGVSTPTNHGWYRYYKSGWVEQGGRFDTTTTSVNLFVVMKDTTYVITAAYYGNDTSAAYTIQIRSTTTTGLTAQSQGANAGWTGSGNPTGYWKVEGYAA